MEKYKFYEVYYVNDNSILRHYGNYDEYDAAYSAVEGLCEYEIRIYCVKEEIISAYYHDIIKRVSKCEFKITKELVFLSGSHAASNEYAVLDKTK
ncbi:MAG: hypothetical protein ABFD07_14480 [Methanobacterium sp.]